MAHLENKELYLHPDYDCEKFPIICGMFDENDLGYTRGVSDIFIDRLEEFLELEPESDCQAEIDYIDNNDINYITVSY